MTITFSNSIDHLSLQMQNLRLDRREDHLVNQGSDLTSKLSRTSLCERLTQNIKTFVSHSYTTTTHTITGLFSVFKKTKMYSDRDHELPLKVNTIFAAAKFTKSLLLGTHGSYQIRNLLIQFLDDPENEVPPNKKTRCCLIGSFCYCHTMVHELGHALLLYLLSDQPKIEIYTNANGCAITAISSSKLLDSCVSLAGPLSDMVFSNINLLAIAKFKNFFTPPIPLALMFIEIFHIYSETKYAITSTWKQDDGDFGLIRQNGLSHLCGSAAVLGLTFVAGHYLALQVLN